jgi:hypothetical protein
MTQRRGDVKMEREVGVIQTPGRRGKGEFFLSLQREHGPADTFASEFNLWGWGKEKGEGEFPLF